MRATRIDAPIIIKGGFAGHCVNNHEIRYTFESIEDGHVVEIRETKKGWKDKHGNRYELSNEPVNFYDYNF